jgi:hypothetical protein
MDRFETVALNCLQATAPPKRSGRLSTFHARAFGVKFVG